MSQERISLPSIKNGPESQWEELSKKRIYDGHLNEKGRKIVAEQFLISLATLSR